MTSVKERFLRYIQMETTSCEANEECPSTPGQRVLAEALAEEMLKIGVSDARVDENGYVYGFIPAKGMAEAPAIGLIAHMDTSDAVPGVTRPQMCERMLAPDAPAHGKICIAFTPDEEIGRGADRFDVPGFGADFAYTVDGGALGELEYECFNAATCRVKIHGLSIHPGSAKNQMKNAALIAVEFASLLPPWERPEHTEGYEGFYHLTDLTGNEEEASLVYILRDHDSEKFEEKKHTVQAAADFLNQRHGAGTVTVELKDSYRNMKEIVEQHPDILERARQAFLANGVEPLTTPIRGGTDGARLSYMGLPCPNLSTGGYNFHSRKELIPVPALERMVDVLVSLVSLS